LAYGRALQNRELAHEGLRRILGFVVSMQPFDMSINNQFWIHVRSKGRFEPFDLTLELFCVD